MWLIEFSYQWKSYNKITKLDSWTTRVWWISRTNCLNRKINWNDRRKNSSLPIQNSDEMTNVWLEKNRVCSEQTSSSWAHFNYTQNHVYLISIEVSDQIIRLALILFPCVSYMVRLTKFRVIGGVSTGHSVVRAHKQQLTV